MVRYSLPEVSEPEPSCWRRRLEQVSLHRSVHLALGVALRDGRSFVVAVLAAGEGELDLDVPALVIHAQRDQGVARLLGSLRELRDLAGVGQKLPRSNWIVVEAVAGVVWRDVRVVEPKLAALDSRVRLAEVDFSLANGLDLGPRKGDAHLERFKDGVFVKGSTIGRVDPLLRRGFLTHYTSSGLPSVCCSDASRMLASVQGGVRGCETRGASSNGAGRDACLRLVGEDALAGCWSTNSAA